MPKITGFLHAELDLSPDRKEFRMLLSISMLQPHIMSVAHRTALAASIVRHATPKQEFIYAVRFAYPIQDWARLSQDADAILIVQVVLAAEQQVIQLF